MRKFLGWLFPPKSKEEAPDPIIVVSGLPRSGTSMMMGMLEAGGLELVVDGIRAADEDNPRGYYELERVKDLAKAEDKSWLVTLQGKGVKVISLLLQHLPEAYNYKIIFMRRSIAEVLDSQSKMLERRGESQSGQSGLTDEDMASIFAQHLTKVEALVARRPRCEVLYVDYRGALDSPATVAEQVDKFLGKGLDVEKMAGVVDKSLYHSHA